MTEPDLRLVCVSCGTKWFTQSGAREAAEAIRCGACDGPLIPLSPNGDSDHDGRPPADLL